MDKEKAIFFSIIVPARNEEKYLDKTIESLKKLEYPKDRHEIIIVENGSTDNTFSLAEKLSGGIVRSYSLKENGVSRARNFGASKSHRKTEWFIFIDADTIPQKDFLTKINEFILADKDNKYTSGTTKLLPFSQSKKMKIFFTLYNFYLKLIKATFAIQIVKKEVFNKCKFDESLSIGEDNKNLKEFKKFGKFFFIKTTNVTTSVRRFEKQGILKIISIWSFAAIMPKKIIKKFDYKIIR
jgi:glycosyltransferase involved in cell wall biosynthesis